jgi:hypothetical protein
MPRVQKLQSVQVISNGAFKFIGNDIKSLEDLSKAGWSIRQMVPAQENYIVLLLEKGD